MTNSDARTVSVHLTPYRSLRPEDVSPELFRRFLVRFDLAGGNLAMLQGVANDPERTERLVHFFKEEDSKHGQIIRFTYDMPLDDMIAAGKYSHVSEAPYIPRKLEISPGMEGEVRMPHLYETRAYRLVNLLEELAKKGLRLANLAELLLYGANYPEEQKRYTILCATSRHYYHGDMFGLFYREENRGNPKMLGRGLSSFNAGSSGGNLPTGWRGFQEYHRIAVVRE